MDFDRTKLRALVLYIFWRTSHVDGFGVTKLNKVLWFSEARAFESLGAPICGEEFVRDKFGPRSKHVGEVCAELVDDGFLEPFTEWAGEFNVVRYRALSPPDTSDFSSQQMALVDWWIKTIAEKHTATSISELSHDYGWEVAAQGEQLPSKAFLARTIREPRTQEEVDRAAEQARRLGLT